MSVEGRQRLPQNKLSLFRTEDVILALLALCIVPYSIFSRFFAELHVRLYFLDFPIFVGEMLLFVCLLLSFYNWAKTNSFPLKFSPWKLACIFYIVFVLSKAYSGYLGYGPLALRHAAMFYYPFFALIAYYAFQKGVLIYKIRFLLFIAALFIIKFVYVAFYLYTYVIIAVVLALTFKKKILRYFGIALTLSVVPYGYFFGASRTLLVASLAAFLSFLVMTVIVLRIRRIFKIYLLFLGLFLIVISFSALGSKGAVFSLTSPGKFMEYKSFYDEAIEQRMGVFDSKEIVPQLYNPNEEIAPRKFKAAFTRLKEEYGITQSGRKSEEILPAKNEPLAESGENPLAVAEVSSLSAITGITQTGKKSEGIPPAKNEPLAESAEGHLPVIEVSPPSITTGLNQEREGVAVSPDTKFGTMLFRYYVYTDAIEQVLNEKHLFGFPFGKPFRSLRCEMIGSAYGEYMRDGWIAMHNSYLDVVYRSGLIGIILLAVLFINIFKASAIFLRSRSFKGAALITILIFWLTTCLFTDIFELPYYAIFFWSMYGVILAFAHSMRSKTAQSMG